MPTLRRSKSLNDKISRQKNRSGDVIRDPRSPDVEGRTRTCVDNFQALVHLRKQTEDKARQLELAYSYATNGHTYLRHHGPHVPPGGVELPFAIPTSSSSSSSRASVATDRSITPVPVVQRRQRSAEGRVVGSGGGSVQRQQSYCEGQQSLHSSRRSQYQQQQKQQQPQKCPRPMSMVEPSVGGLFPSQDELKRKDQVIHNLTESQRGLNAHNRNLQAKVDELEFHNRRLLDALQGHGLLQHGAVQYPGSRPSRSVSMHGDIVRVSGGSSPAVPISGPVMVVSPNSETSVSGYGSLAESPCGPGGDLFPAESPSYGLGRREGPVVTGGRGAGEFCYEGEEDDTLPLSGVSEGSLESRNYSLAKSSMSSSSSLSGGSRAPTLQMESDKSGGEGSRGKVDQASDLDCERQADSGRRIEELAKQVAELSSQRDTVLYRYKQLVEEQDVMVRREESLHDELGDVLHTYSGNLEQVVLSQLQIVQEQLKGPRHDLHEPLEAALASLVSPGPIEEGDQGPSVSSTDGNVVEKLVDLTGPDFHRLGRALGVPLQDLQTIETQQGEQGTCREKCRLVLHAWLAHWYKGENSSEGNQHLPPLAQQLHQALRQVDKDLLLCHAEPVSKPERQALRNCLRFAMDHVTDPRDLLDHLIALNELTPAGMTFIQEVLDQRDRALSRLWHVAEYRGTGIVSRLALALDRSHCPLVSHRLRDELELQNSRMHSQDSQPAKGITAPASGPAVAPVPVSTPTPTPTPTPTSTPSPDSASSASQPRSRPVSRVPRLRSKTVDTPQHAVKPPAVPEGPTISLPQKTGAPAPPLRQVSLTRGKGKEAASSQKEKQGAAVHRERPASGLHQGRSSPGPALQKERAMSAQHGRNSPAPAVQKDRLVCAQQGRRSPQPPPSHKEGLAPLAQQEKTAIAAPRSKDRPFSPLQRDRQVVLSGKAERAASPLQRDERPLSGLHKAERPFSPLLKEDRPYSPLTKEERPLSPVVKDERAYSPLQKQTPPPSAAQKEKAGPHPHHQRDKQFPPLRRDRSIPSARKDRAIPALQKDRQGTAADKDRQAAASAAKQADNAAPASHKERSAVWDKRTPPCSSSSGLSTPGARNSIVLEQGSKISRV